MTPDDLASALPISAALRARGSPWGKKCSMSPRARGRRAEDSLPQVSLQLSASDRIRIPVPAVAALQCTHDGWSRRTCDGRLGTLRPATGSARRFAWRHGAPRQCAKQDIPRRVQANVLLVSAIAAHDVRPRLPVTAAQPTRCRSTAWRCPGARPCGRPYISASDWLGMARLSGSGG